MRSIAERDPEWADQAACRGMSDLFFDSSTEAQDAARRVCRTCPVLGDCLTDALAIESPDPGNHAGVRAGMTPAALVNLRRKKRRGNERRSGPAPQPINHGTHGGYQTHRYRGEEPCEDCREAMRVASRTSQAKHRAARKAAS